jgi:hypothetical protein
VNHQAVRMESAARQRQHQWVQARRRVRGRAYMITMTLLAGAGMLGAGIWCLAAPSSFAEAVKFPPAEHFVHDLGAFQVGIGVTLLLALTWSDGLALALAGFLVANSVHAVNHAVDLDLGG